jgi:GPH family glycoside/pentoside/hexuronide:cation symporter
LRDIILIFKKGSPFNQLIISQLFNGIANALPATLFVFFTTYVLKRPDLAGPLLVFYFLAATISVPIWVKLTNIWPKERCWKIAMVTAAVTFLAVLLVDEKTISLFVVITIITGMMAGADLSIPASMLADIIDDDANKTGYRRPGIYFAVWGTTSKLTFAFAIVIAFSLLGMEIFEPSEENILVDTNWLIILYALLPPIFKIVSVVLLSRYNLKPREVLQ